MARLVYVQDHTRENFTYLSFDFSQNVSIPQLHDQPSDFYFITWSMETQYIKNDWKKIVEGTMTIDDEGMNVFAEYWVNKVKKKTQRELFDTNNIKKVVIKVLKKFRDIEQRFSLKVENPNPAGRNGNILLTGVKGVGKTLLMRALHGFATDICAGFLSIYISYENKLEGNMPSIFDYYRQQPGFHDIPSTAEGLDDWCFDNSKTVVLFADEIQELYKSTTYLDRIKEILVVGKCEASFGVVSGSNQCIRSLVHKATIYTGPEYFNAECVNLNYQVYQELRLLPLRQKTEIESFKAQHDIHTDENELFKKTGGVGGNLVNFDGELTILHILKEMEDPSKRTIIHKLYCKNSDIKADNVWNQQKVSYSDFPQFRDTCSSNLLLLCDLGILFTADSVHYEFLVPGHIFLLQYYMANDPEKYLLYALEGTLSGWGKGSSPGHALEYELRKRLVGEYSPFEHCDYSEQCLSFSTSTKKNCIKLSVAGIDDMLNKMLYLCTDNGSDGFTLNGDMDDPNMIYIHHLQIKTGKQGKKITRGGPSSKDNDTTIVGIKHKFVRSFNTISEQLNTRFPSFTFKAKSFTLLTTKDINSDAKSFIEEGIQINGESVPFVVLEKDVVSELLKEELSTLAIVLS
eukprot:NODE_105_length_19900_cov_0.306550.p2 type:complete len:630 gc:universal NODE_105_length_19900_cov_0.306550:3974-5863(+)